jgi:site-specific recombinase XerD
MELVPKAEFSIVTRAASKAWIPELIAAAGPEVTETYIDFFTATIRNRNTRQAYARACWQFFDWCAAHGLELTTVRPFHVAVWIEDFPGSKPTVKLKLAAVRMLFDFLVVRQMVSSNPAHAVRGPKYVVKKGKTPVWSREDAKTLLDSIPKDSVSGLRDRALIAAMLYSFARVSAVLKLKLDDYYHNGARRWLRLHEKGGKEHEMPVHHLLEETLNEYIAATGLRSGQPLFQSVNSVGTAVTGRALNRYNAWAAIRKRARNAGFLTPVGCHTWRATGITIYLENDGRLDRVQQMAGHESPRTTKLYDRTKDEITLSEVERIRL